MQFISVRRNVQTFLYSQIFTNMYYTTIQRTSRSVFSSTQEYGLLKFCLLIFFRSSKERILFRSDSIYFRISIFPFVTATFLSKCLRVHLLFIFVTATYVSKCLRVLLQLIFVSSHFLSSICVTSTVLSQPLTNTFLSTVVLSMVILSIRNSFP